MSTRGLFLFCFIIIIIIIFLFLCVQYQVMILVSVSYTKKPKSDSNLIIESIYYLKGYSNFSSALHLATAKCNAGICLFKAWN